MATAAPASRPGGRSSRILDAIYTATGELVGERAERITFPVIAERAGVNPTTLYRRWPTVHALLEAVAVAALTGQGESVPDTGSLRGDLTRWATIVVEDIGRPERARFIRAMVASRADIVVACPITDRRRDQAADVIARALGRGEAAPTVDQVLDHLIAPLYHRVSFALGVDVDDARRLVDDVLAMTRGAAQTPA